MRAAPTTTITIDQSPRFVRRRAHLWGVGVGGGRNRALRLDPPVSRGRPGRRPAVRRGSGDRAVPSPPTVRLAMANGARGPGPRGISLASTVTRGDVEVPHGPRTPCAV